MPFFGGGQQQQLVGGMTQPPFFGGGQQQPQLIGGLAQPQLVGGQSPLIGGQAQAANCRRPGRSRYSSFPNYQPTGQIEYTATAVYYNTDSTSPRLRNAEARDGPPVELDGRPEDVRAKRKRTDSDERMDKIRGRNDATRLSCGLNSGFATVIEPTMIEPPVFEPTTKKPHTGMKVHQSFTLY